MNTVEYCPKLPFERWYDYHITHGVIEDSKLNIWPKTIYISKHGQFPYTIHETAEGFTYLKLLKKPDDKSHLWPYIYLNYTDYIRFGRDWYDIIHASQSCMMRVHECKNKESVEERIRVENGLPEKGGIDVYCNRSWYVRHVNKEKLDLFMEKLNQ